MRSNRDCCFEQPRRGWCVVVCSRPHGVRVKGRNVILNFDEARVPRLIEQERVTITNLVPTMGAMLLHGDALGKHERDSLHTRPSARTCNDGRAPLSPDERPKSTSSVKNMMPAINPRAQRLDKEKSLAAARCELRLRARAQRFQSNQRITWEPYEQ